MACHLSSTSEKAETRVYRHFAQRVKDGLELDTYERVILTEDDQEATVQVYPGDGLRFGAATQIFLITEEAIDYEAGGKRQKTSGTD
jgi:hypothetical protein